MKKVVITSLLFLGTVPFLLGFGGVKAEAAGCGNWYVTGQSSPFCSGPCGPPEGPRAHIQTIRRQRKCVNNSNKTYYENGSYNKKLGCC